LCAFALGPDILLHVDAPLGPGSKMYQSGIMKKPVLPTQGCRHACADGVCMFSCKKIPPGDYKLTVAPEVMAFAKNALTKKREYGGRLSIDVASGMLRLGGGSWGTLDSSSIPHGIYE